MSIEQNMIDQALGQDVYGADGEKIGRVGQIYLDDVTGKPEWATVQTGLFGTKESFVPIAQADLAGDGVRVPFEKATVKDAPRVEADQGHLSQDEEAELYRHYGMDYSQEQSDSGLPDGFDNAPTGRSTSDGSEDGDQFAAAGQLRERDRDGDGVFDDAEAGAVGHDTSGPTTDEAMTRSEERLKVGTEKVETGRVRLRKYVVTEEQTVTVPVEREEVRLEREPITDANREDALDGPAISEEEHEVVLTEERPVVQKEAVPVERVRLAKDTVVEEEQVSEQVRKEQIETDAPETDTSQLDPR